MSKSKIDLKVNIWSQIYVGVKIDLKVNICRSQKWI